MQKTKDFIEKNIPDKSFSASEDVIEDLNTLLNEVNDIKNLFNSKMVDEMTIEFINLIKSIELISFNQQLLSSKLSEFSELRR